MKRVLGHRRKLRHTYVLESVLLVTAWRRRVSGLHRQPRDVAGETGRRSHNRSYNRNGIGSGQRHSLADKRAELEPKFGRYSRNQRVPRMTCFAARLRLYGKVHQPNDFAQ